MGVRAALLLVVLFALACGPAREPKTVSLRMIGSPPNASVTVDDQFVGSLAVVQARGVALPPGQHRISVEAAGFFPFDKIVEAKEGDAPIRVDVQLTPVPD
jgi:hypothetical protein